VCQICTCTNTRGSDQKCVRRGYISPFKRDIRSLRSVLGCGMMRLYVRWDLISGGPIDGMNNRTEGTGLIKCGLSDTDSPTSQLFSANDFGDAWALDNPANCRQLHSPNGGVQARAGGKDGRHYLVGQRARRTSSNFYRPPAIQVSVQRGKCVEKGAPDSAARSSLTNSRAACRPLGSWSFRSQRHAATIASIRTRHSRSSC